MRYISIDSSLSNTGVCCGTIENGIPVPHSISLIQTVPTKVKTVRKSSDTITRCRKTYNHIVTEVNRWEPQVIFVETPSGSQSASGMKSYGVVCQLIACLQPLPIEVTPDEVKRASVGKKTASKKEMIEWAYGLYPTLDWFWHGGKLQGKNEHVADAIAVAYAGVKTPQFQQILSILSI